MKGSEYGDTLYAEFQRGSLYNTHRENPIDFASPDFYEIYDSSADPWMMHNLLADPQKPTKRSAKMRDALEAWYRCEAHHAFDFDFDFLLFDFLRFTERVLVLICSDIYITALRTQRRILHAFNQLDLPAGSARASIHTWCHRLTKSTATSARHKGTCLSGWNVCSMHDKWNRCPQGRSWMGIPLLSSCSKHIGHSHSLVWLSTLSLSWACCDDHCCKSSKTSSPDP